MQAICFVIIDIWLCADSRGKTHFVFPCVNKHDIQIQMHQVWTTQKTEAWLLPRVPLIKVWPVGRHLVFLLFQHQHGPFWSTITAALHIKAVPVLPTLSSISFFTLLLFYSTFLFVAVFGKPSCSVPSILKSACNRIRYQKYKKSCVP